MLHSKALHPQPAPPQKKTKPTKVQQNRDVTVTAGSERKLRSWDKSKEAERVGEEQTQQNQFQAKHSTTQKTMEQTECQ